MKLNEREGVARGYFVLAAFLFIGLGVGGLWSVYAGLLAVGLSILLLVALSDVGRGK